MSQSEKLFKLLSDFRVHSTPEILERVYGSEHLGIARISARIFDVQRKYGCRIESRKSDGKSSVWEYQMQRPLNDQTLFDLA